MNIINKIKTNFIHLNNKFGLFIFLDLLNASLKLILFQKLPAINVEFLEIKIDF